MSELCEHGPVLPEGSRRSRKKPQCLAVDSAIKGHLSYAQNPETKCSFHATIAHWQMVNTDPEDETLDDALHWTPMALRAAKNKNDPDVPNYQEAMTGPHREEFIKAMKKEIEELEARKCWTGALRRSVPKNAQIIPLTWAFKIKRLPNGDFEKFKARICVRGDLQEVVESVLRTSGEMGYYSRGSCFRNQARLIFTTSGFLERFYSRTTT